MQASNELNCWRKFIEEGDINALSKLYSLYVDDLFLYGVKIHPDKQLVKDAIQEVFTHIIEKQNTLKVTDKVKVYIFKSLRNQILEELRTRNRKNNIETSISRTDNNITIDAEQEFMSIEEHKIRERIINLALQNLSEHQRESVFLKYALNCTYEEIAKILEIDIASARTLLYRSLKQVKDFINKNSLFKLVK